MAIIVKDYVLDFTNPLRYVLMEFESVDGGLTYRYVYGLRRLHTVIYGIPQGVGAVVQWTYRNADGSVSITDSDPNNPDAQRIVKLFHHQDRLGSTDYLTDNISGRITSYVSYDDFGMLTAKAIIRLGQRELDLVTNFTGHFFDPVLGIYYARARMYDAANRRFMAQDPIKDGWNWFAYANNNPIKYVDPTGLYIVIVGSDERRRRAILANLQRLTHDTLTMDSAGNVNFNINADNITAIRLTWPSVADTKAGNLAFVRYYFPEFVCEVRIVEDGIFIALERRSLPLGTVLIRNLIRSNRTATIQYTAFTNYHGATAVDRNEANWSNGVGTDVVVTFDPSSPTRLTTICLTTHNLAHDPTPTHIILAHELIHAWAFMTGTILNEMVEVHFNEEIIDMGRVRISYRKDQEGVKDTRVLMEDVATIGLIHGLTSTTEWVRRRHITENAIRAEHGLDPRVSFNLTLVN